MQYIFRHIILLRIYSKSWYWDCVYCMCMCVEGVTFLWEGRQYYRKISTPEWQFLGVTILYDSVLPDWTLGRPPTPGLGPPRPPLQSWTFTHAPAAVPPTVGVGEPTSMSFSWFHSSLWNFNSKGTSSMLFWCTFWLSKLSQVSWGDINCWSGPSRVWAAVRASVIPPAGHTWGSGAASVGVRQRLDDLPQPWLWARPTPDGFPPLLYLVLCN